MKSHGIHNRHNVRTYHIIQVSAGGSHKPFFKEMESSVSLSYNGIYCYNNYDCRLPFGQDSYELELHHAKETIQQLK